MLVNWSIEYCPTLTKGSNWQITQIWESYVFRLDLAYSTSIPILEQKHSSCWKKYRYNDISLMSMYMTDTFCSFTRNFIFKSCFLLSECGRIDPMHWCHHTTMMEDKTTMSLWYAASTLFMNTALLWQKEATLENKISWKWAKWVSRVHWHQYYHYFLTWMSFSRMSVSAENLDWK